MGKGDFLDPKTFQAVTPTLGVGSTTTPPDRGDFINAISLTAGDPDRAQALTGFAVVAPTLGLGSVAAPHGHGDAGDVLGSSQNSDTGTGVYALIAFQTVTPALGLGTVTHAGGHGDIGDVGGPSELPGIPNDSGAGPADLITWAIVTPTLGVGSTPAPKQHGDLGEIYGTLGSTVEGLTWEVVTPTLTTGTVAPVVSGQGDVEAVAYGSGYGPGSQTWVGGAVAPVLTAIINGLSPSVSLSWTGIGIQSVYNVYRSTNGGAFVLYQQNVAGLSYVDTNVVVTNVYSYYVASVLPFIVSNTVNPFVGLVAPVLTDSLPGNATIVLNWTSIGIATSYSVYKSTNGGAFVLLASGITALTYADAALVRGNNYSYYVVSLFPSLMSNSVGPIGGVYTDTYTVAGTYTWTKRAGAYQLDFPNWVGPGGGGHGGGVFVGSGSGNSGGGGASGGGYAQIFSVPASQVTSSVTVTIGVAGVGGAGAANTSNPGTNATATSFGTYIVCGGGTAGAAPQTGTKVFGGTGTITGLTGINAYTEQGGFGPCSGGSIFPNVDGGSTTLAPAGGGGGTQGNFAVGGIAGTGGACGSIPGGVGGANTNGSFPPPASGGGQGGNGASGSGEGPGVSNCGSGAGAGGNRTDTPVATGGAAGVSGRGAGGAGGGSGWAVDGGTDTPVSGSGSDGGAGYGKVITYLW